MAKKILIADDDLYLRELYEEVLKEAGFDITTAVDGEDALTKMKAGGYDLVLLDVMMPKMDGLDVLKRLSETPPAVKNGIIILLTNLSHGSIIKEGMDNGAKSYLVKADLTPDQLVEKVNEFLKA